MKWIAAVAMLLCLIGAPAVSAQTVEELYAEQLEASGAEELIAALPTETRELLARLGLDTLSADYLTDTDTDTLLTAVWQLLCDALHEPLSTAGFVLGAVLLYGWAEGLRHSLRTEQTAAVFGSVCALAVCGSVLIPLADTVAAVGEAMTSASVFMGSFAPVYAAILLSGGNPATALSFQSVVLVAAQLLSFASGGIIVPLMTASLALGVTGSVTPQVQLGGVGKLLGRIGGWLLTLGTVLFTGLLSAQSMVSGAADNLSARALRFSVSSFVPVVGGSLGEMLGTVRGCLQLLRSTLGSFGVVATALIILPSLCRCIGWCVLLAVCHAAADMFQLNALTGVLDTARTAMKNLVGVLCAGGTFLIIAVTVVTTAAGG